MGKIPLLVAEQGTGAILKGVQVSEQEQDFWRIHGVGFYFKVKFFLGGNIGEVLAQHRKCSHRTFVLERRFLCRARPRQ